MDVSGGFEPVSFVRVFGGLKRSSQNPGEECWGGRSVPVRSCVAAQATFSRPTSSRAAAVQFTDIASTFGTMFQRHSP